MFEVFAFLCCKFVRVRGCFLFDDERSFPFWLEFASDSILLALMRTRYDLQTLWE
jgi:hypothetical protein